MTAIKLTAFIGEQPRLIPSLLPDTAAKSAVNVRLDDGGLTPSNEPVQVHNLGATGAATIYRHGEIWRHWSDPVHAVPGPVATDRLYVTGDGAPKMIVGEDEYALALPRPTGVPTATLDGSGAGDVVTRIYAYTWVTSLGEESEPSPASNAVDWQPGHDVILDDFDTVPADRAVTLMRIYRSQTGSAGTGLYLIAERAASDTPFTDDIAQDAFLEPLPSVDWTAPPDDLSGLIALPNGMMAAFVGRRLYFCEPYRPHAWPEKYVLTTDFDIVGLGALGTSVIVATKGTPYLVQGTHPSSMAMVKIEANYPCINARGLVDMGSVIAYPTHEGLVTIDGAGGARIVSENLFDRDAWLQLSPASFIASQHGGRYLAFYTTTNAEVVVQSGVIIIDIRGSPYLIRAAEQAEAVFYEIGSGALYFVPPSDSNIYRFDAPEGARTTLYWRSKEFRLPRPENFGIILIDADQRLSGQEEANMEAARDAVIASNEELIADGPIGADLGGAPIGLYAIGGDVLAPLPEVGGVLNVGVWANGELVAQVGRTNVPERLPGGFLARDWEIEVSGDVQIERIVMASTVEELQRIV